MTYVRRTFLLCPSHSVCTQNFGIIHYVAYFLPPPHPTHTTHHKPHAHAHHTPHTTHPHPHPQITDFSAARVPRPSPFTSCPGKRCRRSLRKSSWTSYAVRDEILAPACKSSKAMRCVTQTALLRFAHWHVLRSRLPRALCFLLGRIEQK